MTLLCLDLVICKMAVTFASELDDNVLKTLKQRVVVE